MLWVKDHPAVIEELDVVDESDQITHLLRLEEAGKTEDILSKEKLYMRTAHTSAI